MSRAFSRILVFAVALGAVGHAPAMAQSARNLGNGETRIPGIWIDPDGCQHWVMDDGWEGYMSPVIMPDGRPVCGQTPQVGTTCGLVASDQFFASGSAALSAASASTLRQFFEGVGRRKVIIDGHTDSRASDAYNIDLSRKRAEAVAAIAQSVGVRVTEIRAFGERAPKASNATAAGRAMNRRVEIQCVN